MEANLRGANLGGTDLREADLRWTNLRGANLRETDLRWTNLRGANLRGADLGEANLRGANLMEANLRGANLRGADLDFSYFLLWCGSFDMKVDLKFIYQLCYHICRLENNTKTFKIIKTFLKPFANRFHRVNECGKIK
jgi:hypothetical protein